MDVRVPTGLLFARRAMSSSVCRGRPAFKSRASQIHCLFREAGFDALPNAESGDSLTQRTVAFAASGPASDVSDNLAAAPAKPLAAVRDVHATDDLPST